MSEDGLALQLLLCQRPRVRDERGVVRAVELEVVPSKPNKRQKKKENE